MDAGRGAWMQGGSMDGMDVGRGAWDAGRGAWMQGGGHGCREGDMDVGRGHGCREGGMNAGRGA